MEKEPLETLESLYPPSYVTSKTGLGAENLKKYARLFERLSNNDNFYQRDSRKARLYTDKDIEALQHVITLKDNHGVTLERAVRLALSATYQIDAGGSETGITASVIPGNNGITGYNDLGIMGALVEKQNETINSLVEENKKINEKLELLLKEVEQAKKGGWFNRIFGRR